MTLSVSTATAYARVGYLNKVLLPFPPLVRVVSLNTNLFSIRNHWSTTGWGFFCSVNNSHNTDMYHWVLFSICRLSQSWTKWSTSLLARILSITAGSEVEGAPTNRIEFWRTCYRLTDKIWNHSHLTMRQKLPQLEPYVSHHVLQVNNRRLYAYIKRLWLFTER